MIKTEEQWTNELNDINYLMDDWDSDTSVEVYPTDSIIVGLVGQETVDDWNNRYVDEDGDPIWCLHLYAYYADDYTNYEGVLYTDVDNGENWYTDLVIENNLKIALDNKVYEYMTSHNRI